MYRARYEVRVPENWKEVLKNILIEHVDERVKRAEPYRGKNLIDLFIEYIEKVVNEFNKFDIDFRKEFYTRIFFLTSLQEHERSIRAKLNAFYGFLAFKRFIPLNVVKDFKNAGSYTSIYKWYSFFNRVCSLYNICV